MGQAVSINDYKDVITPSFNPDSYISHNQVHQGNEKIHSAKLTPSYGQDSDENDTNTNNNDKIRSSSISRSNSNHSLSQLSSVSNMSCISTISMSDKFVSYENTLIEIPRSITKKSEWKLIIKGKYNDSIMESMEDPTNDHLCIVFGICDKSLLSLGHKHKYYGYGYSVTYCHGFKFQSFATSFKKTDNIVVKYDKINGLITFYANDIKQKQSIRISSKVDNVITIKPYDDAYDIEVQSL